MLRAIHLFATIALVLLAMLFVGASYVHADRASVELTAGTGMWLAALGAIAVYLSEGK